MPKGSRPTCVLLGTCKSAQSSVENVAMVKRRIFYYRNYCTKQEVNLCSTKNKITKISLSRVIVK